MNNATKMLTGLKIHVKALKFQHKTSMQNFKALKFQHKTSMQKALKFSMLKLQGIEVLH